jgi:hypothetical protein
VNCIRLQVGGCHNCLLFFMTVSSDQGHSRFASRRPGPGKGRSRT